MWIVRLALNRPYTILVMAISILILGLMTLYRTPKDIFPSIDIPVVSIIWNYGGLSPVEMERRMTTITERAMTTIVNDIEHIESSSLRGISVIRVYFHPNVNIGAAVAQVTAVSQTLLKIMPPGATPPFILRYDASSVPILQLGVSSKTIPEQTLFDLSLNRVRTQLGTVQGASVPLPYGGKARTVQVDLNLEALYARGLTGADVSKAIQNQNLILPAGTIKFGTQDLNVSLNASPDKIEEFNNFPLTEVPNDPLRISDVATVRDGFGIQTNIVHQDALRGSLLTVLKNGNASTLDVVARVKAALPRIQQQLPKEMDMQYLFDQSIFVKAALEGVVYEGALAACLTALMMLMFLGSWRSTLVVVASIPLAVLCSVIALGALGQTFNVMTLGGLSLAVGILVDDATVEVENIHRNRAMGKGLRRSILDGAQQIAMPTMVSTLCICIVFVSVVFLTGPAKFLFTPLAEAVVFAMLASYLLSRTLVPTLCLVLLRNESHSGWLHDFHVRFNQRFERLQQRYALGLARFLDHPKSMLIRCIAVLLFTACLVPLVGRDFFPQVDAGKFRLHLRAPAGTRLEETEQVFFEVGRLVREVIPEAKVQRTLDNIGLPLGGFSLAYGDNSNISGADGELLVELKPGLKVNPYLPKLRQALRQRYPQLVTYFQPADIVNQILNFGLPSSLDIQISGRDPSNWDLTHKIYQLIQKIPGAVDVHIHQVVDAPEVHLEIDREKARRLGLTQKDVATSLLLSLSGSGQTAPNYWLDPKSGVSYSVAVQAPQRTLDSMDSLLNIPVAISGKSPQLMSNLVTVSRRTAPDIVSHYNVQPLYDIHVNVEDRDLGSVYSDVQKVLSGIRAQVPKSTIVDVRGQAKSMVESLQGLSVGIGFAFILVYLLLVVNFQSLRDPLVIISALPGALCGVVWMLFMTHTTFNVPSLMGAIMSLGVATANSILVVTFARERTQAGDSPRQAALMAGQTRLRPVIMTALAMVVGMIPMSLGWGEGGEQNAPLGRAVIGGLMLATLTTLYVVPVIYARYPSRFAKEEDDET